MEDLIYLKHEEDNEYFAFNKKNLTSIGVFTGEIRYKTHQDLKDFNWDLGYNLQNGYFQIDKDEFLDVYYIQIKRLTEITNEL